VVSFRENRVQNFLGRGTFSISPPCVAPFPHLTLGYFGTRDLDKNTFCWGDRPPFGGDMNFGRFALWPIFSRTVTARFWKFQADR